MSSARKCDKCGSLFEATHGCLTLGEVCVMSRKPPSMATWSDADFCLKCSKDILVLIGPALQGITTTLRKHK